MPKVLYDKSDRIGIGLAGVPRDLRVERLHQLALARVVVLVEEPVYPLEEFRDAVGGREVQSQREAITGPALAPLS